MKAMIMSMRSTDEKELITAPTTEPTTLIMASGLMTCPRSMFPTSTPHPVSVLSIDVTSSERFSWYIGSFWSRF